MALISSLTLLAVACGGGSTGELPTSSAATTVPPATVGGNPTATAASRPSPTVAPTATAVMISTPTPQSRASATPTVRPDTTSASAITPTASPTGVPTLAPVPTVTQLPLPTTTPTLAPAPTNAPTLVATATPSPTLAPTVAPTLAATSTPEPTPTPTPDLFMELRSTLLWADGDLSADEEIALTALSNLTIHAPEVASRLASYPWLTDDATEHEAQALQHLDYLASRDLELLNTAAGFPWVEDDITESERYALQNIAALAARDTAKAKIVASLPWVSDSVTDPEYGALGRLADFARLDTSLTASLISLSWLADDVLEEERWALRYLKDVANKNLALSKSLAGMDFFVNSVEVHDLVALSSLLKLSASDLDFLVGQDWFSDGLDDEEAAFVSVLGDLAKRLPEQFRGLVDTHFTQSSKVTLPLAGDVTLIGFRPTPFQAFDPALPLIEDSLMAMESFMKVPFPQTEVIVLFVDQFESNPINDFTLALHVGTHLLVVRPEVFQGDFRHTVAHEVAHYYWHSRNAPIWLREGGADFLASYTLDWNGRKTLADRHLDLSARDVRTCAGRGMDSIQELLDLLQIQGAAKHYASPYFLCHYILGEYLLIKLLQTIGPENSNAWTELYLLSESEERAVTEADIYQAFSRAGQSNEFQAVYDRWHGGEFP